MIDRKTPELNELYFSVDQRKRILAELAVDYVSVKRKLDMKVHEKERMEKSLMAVQKVDEIHIEIDVLQ